MSTTVTINGTTYPYPTQGDSNWASQLVNVTQALATTTLQKAGGSFTVTADVDFGSTAGLKSQYLKSRSANIAQSGLLRLAHADAGATWRNNANTADLALTVDANDKLNFNGQVVTYSGLISNADIASAAAIAYSKLSLTGSIVNADISNSAAIAYSKLSLAASVVNADISSTAAIAYSKLNLAASITNSDIASAAAIAYSKLSLTGSVVNADISSSAAISLSKLAALTTSKALVSDASGLVSASSVTSTELSYVSGVTSAIQTQLNGKQASSTLLTNFAGTADGSSGQVLSTNGSSSGYSWVSPFTNPMTTLGDIVYGGVSGASNRLAGNTASAKQFLTQTGTGTASAAPVWGALQPADLPVASASQAGAISTTAQTLAGIKTFQDGAVIKGVTTGIAIASGNIGEKTNFTSQSITTSSSSAIRGGSAALVTLSAGIWMLYWDFGVTYTASLTSTEARIATNNANDTTGTISDVIAANPTQSGTWTYTGQPVYLDISGSTTIYPKVTTYGATTAVAVSGYAVRIA